VREKGQHSEEMVRGENELVGGHMKTCRSEIEIGIEREHRSAEESSSNMHAQEQCEVDTRPHLEPRNETVLPPPTPNDKRHAATDLQHHSQKEDSLDSRLTVNPAGGLHERDMRGNAHERYKVIRQVNQREHRERDGTNSVEFADCHLETPNDQSKVTS
jgi:hypothetical protein